MLIESRMCEGEERAGTSSIAFFTMANSVKWQREWGERRLSQSCQRIMWRALILDVEIAAGVNIL